MYIHICTCARDGYRSSNAHSRRQTHGHARRAILSVAFKRTTNTRKWAVRVVHVWISRMNEKKDLPPSFLLGQVEWSRFKLRRGIPFANRIISNRVGRSRTSILLSIYLDCLLEALIAFTKFAFAGTQVANQKKLKFNYLIRANTTNNERGNIKKKGLKILVCFFRTDRSTKWHANDLNGLHRETSSRDVTTHNRISPIDGIGSCKEDYRCSSDAAFYPFVKRTGSHTAL